MSATEIEQLYRVEDVARQFDVGRNAIFKLIKSGELRSLKIGTSRRIPASAIEEYLRSATEL